MADNLLLTVKQRKLEWLRLKRERELREGMRTFPVPSSLQRDPHQYPSHDVSEGIETSFLRYTRAERIASSAVYLPILWTNNYHHQRKQSSISNLVAVPEVEKFLETLDPTVQYFTVSQGAEGIYEELPDNVFVFSAGGVGDCPIPLVCSPHPPLENPKTVLASFMGEFAPCGPRITDAPLHRSSSDPNGAGTRVRKKMIDVFKDLPNCKIARWEADMANYRDLMSRTKYGLCPRGYGKTSFRLYEMFSMGVVPVYIYDDPWIPYADELDWSLFCVLCPEREIDFLPYKLSHLSEAWYNRAIRVGSSYFENYFTTSGVCRQIAKMVEKNWQ